MMELPRIRLEIESMKYAIIHAFNAQCKDVEKLIDAEVERAITSFDFEKAVRNTVHEALQSQLDGYFKYGEGREYVDGAIKETFNKALDKKKEKKG